MLIEDTGGNTRAGVFRAVKQCVDVVLGRRLISITYVEERWRRRSSRRCSSVPTRAPDVEDEWCSWHTTSATRATSPCATFSCSFTINQSINHLISRQLKTLLQTLNSVSTNMRFWSQFWLTIKEESYGNVLAKRYAYLLATHNNNNRKKVI